MVTVSANSFAAFRRERDLPKSTGGGRLAERPEHMELLARITTEPEVRFGKPCVRRTRITVGEVLGFLATGQSEAELLAEFPQLTHDDVLACFGFAAEREDRVQFIPVQGARDLRGSLGGMDTTITREPDRT